MGLFDGFADKWRRSDPEKAFSAGREAGERLREIEPGLGSRPFARQQVILSKFADEMGLTDAEFTQFEHGVYEGYTNKFYCQTCGDYYLPHEH